MRLYPYWARARHDGLTAFGWSADSQLAADQHAAERAQRIAERVEQRRGQPGPAHGGYYDADRPMREEIIDRFDDDATGQPIMALTRNRYGSVVLNTASVMFIDIDQPPAAGGGFFSRLFGGKKDATPESPPQGLIDLEDRGLSMRVYRTAAGWRAAVLDRTITANSDEANHLLTEAGSDPLYVRLCEKQDCFRARLTPKPWRCGCGRPPGSFPFAHEQHEQRYRQWQTDYEAKTAGHAACRFVTTLGSGVVDPLVSPVIELHDSIACDPQGKKPLA